MWISEPETKKAKKGQVDFQSSYPNYLVLMCFIVCNLRIPYDVISGSFPVGKDRRLSHTLKGVFPTPYTHTISPTPYHPHHIKCYPHHTIHIIC